jgi:hypothetical protein
MNDRERLELQQLRQENRTLRAQLRANGLVPEPYASFKYKTDCETPAETKARLKETQ